MTSSDRANSAQLTWTGGDGDAHSQEAMVVSLDQKMVTVAVPGELALHQGCTIAVVNADGESLFAAQATTQFIRPHQGEKHITCRWTRALDQATLDLLAGFGFYDRRAGKRQAITVEAPAWPELSDADGVVPITVVDLSTHGCCVRSPLAVPVGHRLLIHTWGEKRPVETVRMRVQWQQPFGDEFLLGCAFTQKAGHSTLANVAKRVAKSNSPPATEAGGLVRSVLAIGQAGMSIVSDALGAMSGK